MRNPSQRNNLSKEKVYTNPKVTSTVLIYLIEENSSCAAGDVQSLSVKRLDNEIAHLPM